MSDPITIKITKPFEPTEQPREVESVLGDIPQARKAVGIPTFFFCMQLDTDQNPIIGLNEGRLSLWDDRGMIQRWVFTTSFDGRQNNKDWTLRGGVIPPTSAMSDLEWYQLSTECLYQPGQPVDEGYLILYQNSNEFTTIEGASRSEIMCHPDKNYKTSPGSAGCLCAIPDEWYDFKRVFTQSCGHLKSVRIGVVYTF